MANRGWRYRTSLVLLTLILLVPQGFCCFWLGMMYWHRMPSLPPIPGVTRDNVQYSSFSHATFWRGKMVQSVPNYDLIRTRKSSGVQIVNDYMLQFTDPETDQPIGKPIEFPDGYHRPVVLDNRLFLIGMPDVEHPNPLSYEFVDDQLQPLNFAWAAYDALVLIDGELSRIQETASSSSLGVSTFTAGQWTASREIVLPTSEPETLANPISSISLFSNPLTVINHQDRIHLFLRQDGKLYYKVGLTLRSDTEESKTTTYGADDSTSIGEVGSLAEWKQVVDAPRPCRIRTRRTENCSTGALLRSWSRLRTRCILWDTCTSLTARNGANDSRSPSLMAPKTSD